MGKHHYKRVYYWCPKCRHEIPRLSLVARKVLPSICGNSGKNVKMRRIRWEWECS